jgi:hypothetical protein
MWTRAKVPGLSTPSWFGARASNGNARVAVFTVERRADFGVAQLPVGELHARLGRLDTGAEVFRALQRQVVAGLLRLQRRRRIVEHLLRDERALEQLVGAVVGLLRLTQIGARLLDVGRLLDLGEVFGIGGAVLRERARQRGFLLLEVVLLLFLVDQDERLAGANAVAKVGEDPAHSAVGFGRDRHLVDGGQRADELDRSGDALLLYDFDLDLLRGGVATAGLRRFAFRTRRRRHRRDDDGAPSTHLTQHQCMHRNRATFEG